MRLHQQRLVTGLAAAVLGLFLAGCGSKGGEQNPPVVISTLNGVEYGVLEDNGLTRGAAEVRGSGTLIFKNRLPHEEENNFALQFSLEDGGTLSLVPHAEVGLKGGVEVIFGRKGDILTVTLKDGADTVSLEDEFKNPLSAKGAISLDFDVHAHDVGDGHLIIFAGGEEQHFAFSSDLTGSFWGLKLSKATVTAASVGKAKDAH